MLDKDRLQHPERYEVSVYDTATGKFVREFQCFGVVLGLIKEVDITGRGEDIDGKYYSSQPVGVNASPEDIATLIYGLVDMYPEVKTMLSDILSGDIAIEFIPDNGEGEDDEDDD